MRRPTRLLALAALLLLALGCSSEPPPQRNILVIVADTLRADHLGTYGYALGTSPNLDRFAAENLKFNYAISAAPWTSPSVASMFTGFYPTAHGVTKFVNVVQIPDDTLSQDFDTLAEVLQKAGYATSAVNGNPWVTAERGFDQGFDRFEFVGYAKAPVMTERAIEHLDALTAKPPFFLYLHYMDPHPPFEPLPEDVERFLPTSRPADAKGPPGPIAQYDAEIFGLDRSLGVLFEHLRSAGLYEDMIIAIVSDHGFPFMEHGVGWHGRKLHNEDTHVPWLLKLPGVRGEIDETVSTIDLFPTLVRAVGLDPPSGMQGVSVLEDLDTRRRNGAFSEITVRRNHRSIVTHDATKLILAFDKRSSEEITESDERKVVGLYRSRENYREGAKLDDPETTEALRKRMWTTYRESLEIQRGITQETTELPPETIEELRKLGYVE